MALPERVLDMHVHLFNARYLPLDSIIADLIHEYTGRETPGPAVRALADLLWSLTGSSYVPAAIEALPSGVAELPDEACIDAIADIASTEARRLAAEHVVAAADAGESEQGVDYPLLEASLRALASANYAAEGIPPVPGEPEPAMDMAALAPDAAAASLVRYALRRITRIMDPDRWEKGTRYVRFFLTMLSSEKAIARKLFAEYGNVPGVHFVHYMMDMEMAYAARTPPYYARHQQRISGMTRLARDSGGRIRGFAAFDPRHSDWKARFDHAFGQGVLGFKFYPGLGYRPDGDPDAQVSRAISDFLDECCSRQIPVFAHCTPEGFQTWRKLGYYADPAHWETALLANRRELRLCLGHAGGGHVTTSAVHSPGWFARNAGEWGEPTNNYARKVAALCREFPNVYCELGHLTDIFGTNGERRFLENLARAREGEGACDLMDKLIYGSDWSMPHMIDRPREYLDRFASIFAGIDNGKHSDKFFWTNAQTFLGA